MPTYRDGIGMNTEPNVRAWRKSSVSSLPSVHVIAWRAMGCSGSVGNGEVAQPIRCIQAQLAESTFAEADLNFLAGRWSILACRE